MSGNAIDADPLVDIKLYLSQYHTALHLHRAIHVAERLVMADSGAAPPSPAARAQVVTTVLELLVTTSLNSELYQDTVTALFERDFDAAADPAVARRMEAAGIQRVDFLQGEVGKAQHIVDTTNSLPAREVLVDRLLELGTVFQNRGDVQRAAKAFSQARAESSAHESLRYLYLESQLLALFRPWSPSLTPSSGRSHLLGAMEKLVMVPTLLRGAMNVSRSTDAQYVFYIVASALCDLDAKNYRSVAGLLKAIHRYPASATASLQPQVAAEYTSLAAAYISQLPKLVHDTQLTTLRDMVRIATLSLFASHTRSEAQEVVSVGYLKGWLEEDPALNKFVENMIACRYKLALKDLDVLLYGTPFQYEWHSAAGSSLLSAPGKQRSVSHLDRWQQLIRESALEQYTTPYVTLSLPSMADAFGITVQQLEGELRALIESGRLQCRIDTAAQLLRHKETDARLVTYKAVTEAGERILHERLMAARAQSLQRNDVVLKATLEHKEKDMKDRRMQHVMMTRYHEQDDERYMDV